MLPASHNRAYQDFLTLLTKFVQELALPEQEFNQSRIEEEFQRVSRWFEQNVAQLDSQNLVSAIPQGRRSLIASRWQAVQREILREFKLLSTDILFLAASRQSATRLKRRKSINERLTKLISYCQIMLKDDH